ncbi:MAG: sulfate transporter [Gemmataceae bacterium]
MALIQASPPGAIQRLLEPIGRNVRQARLDRHEIAGSLGDLGTFLPLLVGMTAQNGLDFATALFFAGFFNAVTGLTFSIPMAVQPMKAIAAVALTQGLTVPQIVAAGASVSLCILLLGLSGLVDWVNRLIPKSVVRGLQLGLGLSLLIRAFEMARDAPGFFDYDSQATALLAGLLTLALLSSTRLPAALVLLVMGLLLAGLTHPQALAELSWTVWYPTWQPPGWQDFVQAFFPATLPQLPLTLLNSVIAVCALSVDLFPERAASPRKVAVSVGLMNLVGCWFGAMPMCHGAGGLAGQYRFGARTNGSILFLGTVKMLLAVFLGVSLLALCRVFPRSILAVMLGVAGLELALVTRDQTRRSDAFVMLVVASAALGLRHVGVAFLLGLAIAWLARLCKWEAL